MDKSKHTDSKGKKTGKAAVKKAMRVFRFIKPFKVTFGIGFLFLLGTGATALVFPMLMGDLVDAAQEEFIGNINRIALILLLVFIAQAVFSYFRIYLFAIVTQKSLAGLRQEIYTHLITLPMGFFASKRVGDLNSRIAADIALLQDTFTTTIAEFLRQMIIIVGGIFFLTYISPKLTLFMLALVPVLAIAAVFFGKFIKKLSRQTQDKVAESNTIAEETFQGIGSVKAFTNEPYEIERYSKATNEIVRIALTAAKWRGAFASFIIFCLFGSIVAVIWYGTILVQSGDGLSMGDLFSFILYTVFIGASIGGIADHYAKIQKAIGATEALMDLFDEKAETVATTTTSSGVRLPAHGRIGFNQVSFAYPSRKTLEVLNSISFEVNAGEKVAVVGPSGAGKSTIVALLLRFYDPVSGSILSGGVPVHQFPLTDWRNSIAIVPQEVLLFGGTIKENIAYGKQGASDEEIMLAAKMANAYEFIERFPDGFETIVGERGIQLSGGQRQRIAIARAILKDPAILVLDEATSSLDSESEKLVQDALEKLMKGRTSFIIAHRLSTIRNADKIMVLDKGQIREQGTHDELITNKNGLYKNLSKLQFEVQ